MNNTKYISLVSNQVSIALPAITGQKGRQGVPSTSIVTNMFLHIEIVGLYLQIDSIL